MLKTFGIGIGTLLIGSILCITLASIFSSVHLKLEVPI